MHRLKLIAQYLERRFPNSPEYYHNQWRARFDRGEEWNYSDFGGRRVLQELAPDFYPSDIKACKVLPPYPSRTIDTLYAALQVLLLDPEISKHIDPMAKRQADFAVECYEKENPKP